MMSLALGSPGYERHLKLLRRRKSLAHNVSQPFNEAYHLEPEKDDFWQMSAGRKRVEQPFEVEERITFNWHTECANFVPDS